MKKIVDIVLVAAMLAMSVPALSEGGSAPPPPPPGAGQGQPPEMPGEGRGTPPDMPGEGRGTPPDRPGGMGTQEPESREAVYTFETDAAVDGETVESDGDDENAILITGGTVTVTDSEITRDSDSSSGGDAASFYGVGAAILVTGGTAEISGCVIGTDAAGGAGVFAYGDGTAYVSDTEITTQEGASGGIHVAGGGRLKAAGLIVETYGGSSAAIRSDRGGGTMLVDGGSYISHGSGSPAVYVTADISVRDASLTATGAEALCLEGRNSVCLYDCVLSGDMPEDSRNDNTWTVIVYQSMSGDAAVGQGCFVMDGGTLESKNGGLFYTTNTESRFVIRGVEIAASDNCAYFLRVTGNANERGWGQTGRNGADCVFTAIDQEMNGDVICDSVSNLSLYLTGETVWTGAVVHDESCAGEGGSGTSEIVVGEDAVWVLTADSAVTSLQCSGEIVDEEGLTVTVLGADGTVYVEGEGGRTVTVQNYRDEADLTAAGSVEAWEESETF